MLSELIDEVTDSLVQNSIFIMDNYNLKYFNPAVLSICYANMRIFDKG